MNEVAFKAKGARVVFGWRTTYTHWVRMECGKVRAALLLGLPLPRQTHHAPSKREMRLCDACCRGFFAFSATSVCHEGQIHASEVW